MLVSVLSCVFWFLLFLAKRRKKRVDERTRVRKMGERNKKRNGARMWQYEFVSGSQFSDPLSRNKKKGTIEIEKEGEEERDKRGSYGEQDWSSKNKKLEAIEKGQ